jgi:hypothetical protein
MDHIETLTVKAIKSFIKECSIPDSTVIEISAMQERNVAFEVGIGHDYIDLCDNALGSTPPLTWWEFKDLIQQHPNDNAKIGVSAMQENNWAYAIELDHGHLLIRD